MSDSGDHARKAPPQVFILNKQMKLDIDQSVSGIDQNQMEISGKLHQEQSRQNSAKNIQTYGDVMLASQQFLSTNYQVSYDKVLSQIGMGNYQLSIYLIVATLALTEGSQITVFTLMIPILKNEWELEDYWFSLQTSFIFVGFLVGSLLSGQFADRYGRKKPTLIAAYLTVTITLLTALSTNIYELLILRGGLGLICGFLGPISLTFLSETTPKEVRGRYMSIIQLSISIGQLFGLIVGFFTLDSLESGNWRALIFWTGFPGIWACLAASFLIDESAKYLLVNGEYEAAFKIMEKMNTINGQQSFDNFNSKLRIGVINWSVAINHVHGSEENARVATIFGDNDLLKLLISALSEVIAAGIAAILIDLKGFGRKNSIIYFCSCIGISAFLAFYDAVSHFLFWTLVCKFFITMTMIFSYQLTTEMYDTKIRATGVGTGIAVGRMGGVVMPWICMALMEYSLLLPFLLFTFLAFSVTVLDCYLEETLGKDLD